MAKRTQPLTKKEEEFNAGFTPFTLNCEGLALDSLRQAENYIRATSLDASVRGPVLIDIGNAIYGIEHALGRA
jgi:hypothetical protein